MKNNYFCDKSGKKSCGRIICIWLLVLSTVGILCAIIGFFFNLNNWDKLLYAGLALSGLGAGGKVTQSFAEKPVNGIGK